MYSLFPQSSVPGRQSWHSLCQWASDCFSGRTRLVAPRTWIPSKRCVMSRFQGPAITTARALKGFTSGAAYRRIFDLYGGDARWIILHHFHDLLANFHKRAGTVRIELLSAVLLNFRERNIRSHAFSIRPV